MWHVQKRLTNHEDEIEENSDILLGSADVINITLAKAIDEYINALGDHFGYSKISWLCLIQEFSIAQDFITKNTSADMTQHAQLSN